MDIGFTARWQYLCTDDCLKSDLYWDKGSFTIVWILVSELGSQRSEEYHAKGKTASEKLTQPLQIHFQKP